MFLSLADFVLNVFPRSVIHQAMLRVKDKSHTFAKWNAKSYMFKLGPDFGEDFKDPEDAEFKTKLADAFDKARMDALADIAKYQRTRNVAAPWRLPGGWVRDVAWKSGVGIVGLHPRPSTQVPGGHLRDCDCCRRRGMGLGAER
jgi:hypothetical protein